MRFLDRHDAGVRLATLLKEYQGQDVIVFGLPRGGVVTASEIAKYLKAPLDVIIARKIGHPHQPEYAIGAITEEGIMVGNQNELDAVDPVWLENKKQEEMQEAKRRRLFYGKKEIKSLQGKIAILVDDGVATGLTMQCAIEKAKSLKPKKIIVAIPVAPKRTAELLRKKAGFCVVVEAPEEYEFLGAVGAYYQDFSQTEDEEVLSLLRTESL